MNREVTLSSEAVSDDALDCFIHGVSHLIDERGSSGGVDAARLLLDLVDEEMQNRTGEGAARRVGAPEFQASGRNA